MKDLPLNYTITVSEEACWPGSNLPVVLDDYYSTPCYVILGVPQGSVLHGSHTIINDIADGIQSSYY